MLTRRHALLLIGLIAATVVMMPGNAVAQQPIRIGASISLTGTYAKPGVYGRDGVTIQWQDGKQVVVWPQDVAGGKARVPTPPWDKR
jgi:hypothetical protein